MFVQEPSPLLYRARTWKRLTQAISEEARGGEHEREIDGEWVWRVRSFARAHIPTEPISNTWELLAFLHLHIWPLMLDAIRSLQHSCSGNSTRLRSNCTFHSNLHDYQNETSFCCFFCHRSMILHYWDLILRHSLRRSLTFRQIVAIDSLFFQRVYKFRTRLIDSHRFYLLISIPKPCVRLSTFSRHTSFPIDIVWTFLFRLLESLSDSFAKVNRCIYTLAC